MRHDRRIAPLMHCAIVGTGLVLAGGALAKTAPSPRAAHSTSRVISPRSPLLAGNAVTGAHLYQACMGCHSLNENDVGPRHRGVVGRKAGMVPDYAYSAAVRNSGVVWTPANLDKWLSNPQKLVPGAKMFFSVAKPQDRADIIAYLAQQK